MSEDVFGFLYDTEDLFKDTKLLKSINNILKIDVKVSLTYNIKLSSEYSRSRVFKKKRFCCIRASTYAQGQRVSCSKHLGWHSGFVKSKVRKERIAFDATLQDRVVKFERKHE